MIGIFDSGRGGQNVLAEVRRLAPLANIAYFADTLGAPYGTKKKDELILRILHDEQILRRAGCERILIGCCTASTLHRALPSDTQQRLFPIVEQTARQAARTSPSGRIAVLCTEASRRTEAFSKYIHKYSPASEVVTVGAQVYVSLAEENQLESGCPAFKKALADTVRTLQMHHSDTVVLGCTHFHALGEHLRSQMPSIRIVSSAKIGAEAFVLALSKEELSGEGVTAYL